MESENKNLNNPFNVGKDIKFLPCHKEVEYIKKFNKNFKAGAYTITGLYSKNRIEAMLNRQSKFNEEVDSLKQILMDCGAEGIFTPVISKKAINHRTNELFIKMQISAGLNRITIIEKDIHQSEEDMELYFKGYIKGFGENKLFFLLDGGMVKVSLLGKKLNKLKEMKIDKVILHFAGYWKYKHNFFQLLEMDKNNRPNILLSGVWAAISRTSCPALLSLFGVEGLSVGYKWGASPNKDSPQKRLDEIKIEYAPLNKQETENLKKEIKVASNDELYAYLRAEAFFKNKNILSRLSNLDEEELKKEIESKPSLSYFFS
ncbi:MAG: hypothetical protein PHG05_04405 [Candidatus Nanoarchaeia archaeon]|nr:hypothetical protein [Candidatus Nanoarchaeia archaeon]